MCTKDLSHVSDFNSSCTLVLIGPFIVVAEDIAEEIVWAASRPPHVNIAEVYVLPVNQASPGTVHRAP